jgi:hypothetical protein
MGGWSQRGVGRPLWATGLVFGSSQGGAEGGSTPGHQGLLGKDRERKKVGNEVYMRWNNARGVSKGKANT